jgi:signal transduction histidine kinase
VTRADAALEMLQSTPSIDLVITDHAMPGMSGMELVDRIHKRRAEFPVIIMTAFGYKEMVVQTLKNPWSGYIEKPFTLKELTEEIKRVTTPVQTSGEPFGSTFYNLVHQINNPLMAIVGSAELSLEKDATNLSQDGRSRLRNIIDAAQRIASINKKIMELGKVLEEAPKPIDVGAVLQQCIQMNADLMQLKRIDLKWAQQHTHCFTMGSQFALEQVFKNLLLNAIESMQDCKTRRLTLSIVNRTEIGQVIVSIEDTGQGIAEDLLSRIFDPRFTAKSDGNGIGLAVVKSIVEHIGGCVDVKSHPGAGSRFTIILPCP